MIPESIRAEIDAHGGLAATEGPDANGITTYRAADGLFVNAGSDGRPRMRGFGAPTNSAQQSPPAATSVQGGQKVALDPNEEIPGQTGMIDDPDLWPEKLPSGVTKDAATWYAHKRTFRDGRVVWEFFKRGAPLAAGEQPQDKVAATMTTENKPVKEKWDKDTATEAKPDQVVTVNGVPSSVVGKDANGRDIWAPVPTPNGPATASPSTTAAKPTNVQVEGKPDGKGGFDNSQPVMASHWPDGRVTYEPLTAAERQQWEKEKNGGKTDAEIATSKETATSETQVTGRPGWVQITTKTGNNSKTQFRGPDGQVVDTLPEETGSSQAQVPNRPGWVAITTKKGNDSKTTYRGPDGKEVDSLPAEAPKDTPNEVTRNGKTYIRHTTPGENGKPGEIYYTDQSGNRVTLPDEGIGNIKGLPSYTPDLTKPGAGLIDYAKQLDEYMAAHPEFTWEKRQAVLENARALATQVAGEFNTGAAVLRENFQQQAAQRGQDMTQANSRAALANSHTQNATALIEKFAPYLGVTPGDAGKLFMGMMASQLATATMYGGMQNQPRVEMDPRLMAFADRTVGGASGGTPGAPATPPGTPPNALGVGALPGGTGPANPDTAVAAGINAARAETPPSAVIPPGVGPGYDAPLAPDAEMVIITDQWGNRRQVPKSSVSSPMSAEGLTIEPFAPGAALPEGVTPYNPTPPPVTAAPVPVNPMPGQPGSDPNTPIGMQSNPAIESLFSNVLPPVDPPSWREQAQTQASYLQTPSPAHVTVGERLVGQAVPTGPVFGGFSLGGPTGPAPMPLQSRIPGLTPEIDEQARRELMAEMGAA